MPERSIYEQLTGVKVDDTTLEQLDFTRNSFIDTKSIEYWKGIITVSKILEASRTYPHGLIIPESGTIESKELAAGGGTAEFRPTGTEIWQVIGLSIYGAAGTPTIIVNLADGTGTCAMHSGDASTSPSSFFPFEAPFTISNTLYLDLINTDGANAATAALAYSKVSL